MLVFCGSSHGAEGWFTLLDWLNKRDSCLTLIVFLMPCDVSVLWLVLMVLRVGLHCEIDGKRELVAFL